MTCWRSNTALANWSDEIAFSLLFAFKPPDLLYLCPMCIVYPLVDLPSADPEHWWSLNTIHTCLFLVCGSWFHWFHCFYIRYFVRHNFHVPSQIIYTLLPLWGLEQHKWILNLHDNSEMALLGILCKWVMIFSFCVGSRFCLPPRLSLSIVPVLLQVLAKTVLTWRVLMPSVVRKVFWHTGNLCPGLIGLGRK